MPTGVYKRTAEHKKKISDTLKGRMPKNSVAGWNKGIVGYGKMTGKNHHQWKGKKVGYKCLHDWVRKWKGKPNHCSVCGDTSKRMYHWCNIDHTYRRVLEDYISMCVPCHRNHDYKNNNYQKYARRKNGSKRKNSRHIQ